MGETKLGLSAASNPNAYRAPSSIAASQVELAADGLSSGLPFNVHMFGYALGLPTVNARVVNETAAALDLVTKLQ